MWNVSAGCVFAGASRFSGADGPTTRSTERKDELRLGEGKRRDRFGGDEVFARLQQILCSHNTLAPMLISNASTVVLKR